MPERVWDDRREHEERLARELAAQLGITEREALVLLGADLDINNIDESFWRKHDTALLLLLIPSLAAIFTASNRNLDSVLIPGVNMGLQDVLASADSWSNSYAGDLVAGLSETSRLRLVGLVSQGLDQGWDIARLGREMAAHGPFTPTRAELIAITETTVAQMAGEEEYKDLLRSMGIQLKEIWLTHPELTATGPCILCAPLDGLARGEGWEMPPPLHPNCVCEVLTFEVTTDEPTV